MLGFLDNHKHYLLDFYKDAFGSRLDLFSFIRLGKFETSEQGRGIALLPGMALGKISSIIYRIGYRRLGGIDGSVFVKTAAAMLKFKKLKAVNSTLRPIWNAYLFAIMPKY